MENSIIERMALSFNAVGKLPALKIQITCLALQYFN